MKKMYDEATRKRWQEATCKAIKDGEDHARLLHNIIKRCRERYGSLLKKFLSVNEELRTTKRVLWLVRAMRAKDKYTTYMHFWDGYDEEDLNFILWKKWQWVERKCREKAEEYL